MSHPEGKRGQHECLNPKCWAWWWCADSVCDGLDRLCSACRDEEALTKARRAEKGNPSRPCEGSRDDEGNT